MQATLQTPISPCVSQDAEAPDTGVTRRLWTRADYYLAAELGFFQPNERIELIQGEIFQKMSPQGWAHAHTISLVMQALSSVFRAGTHIAVQAPLRASKDSEPEPDVMVVKGVTRDYADHPTGKDVLLVVEVSDTTLRYDRRTKTSVYAEASVEEYWIVDLTTRALEVYREPMTLPDALPAFTYKSRTLYTENESLSPLHAPQSVVRVADLLPLPAASS